MWPGRVMLSGSEASEQPIVIVWQDQMLRCRLACSDKPVRKGSAGQEGRARAQASAPIRLVGVQLACALAYTPDASLHSA